MLFMALEPAAFATPQCSIFVDGVQSTDTSCNPYNEPIHSDTYLKSIRCSRTGSLLVVIDYAVKPEISPNPEHGSATISVNYINKFTNYPDPKFNGWMVSNWAAAVVDVPASNPKVNLSVDLSNIIPKRDDFGWATKELVVKCDLGN